MQVFVHDHETHFTCLSHRESVFYKRHMHLVCCIIDPESGENVVSSTNGSRGTHFAVHSGQMKEETKFM